MTEMSCQSVGRQLGAFVDDELPGVLRLSVARHVESCHECASDLDALRDVGDLLRTSARLVPSPEMDGLADGVVTRVRAEQAHSWRATMRRGVDNWHWAIVGFGSVTATSVVALIAVLVLSFGPAPSRSDSLAAVLNEVPVKPAAFVVFDDHGDPNGMFTRVATGGRVPARVGGGVALAIFMGPTEQELVGALSERLTREGRFVDPRAMNADELRDVEELLASITQHRSRTSKAYLWQSTTVSASGL